MRLFIAINLSDELKTALINAQNAMYDRGVRGSYSPEENLHLTLAFIGEYPNAEPVLDALSSVSFRPFELSLEGMGRFGDLWWAGIQDAFRKYEKRALPDCYIRQGCLCGFDRYAVKQSETSHRNLSPVHK